MTYSTYQKIAAAALLLLIILFAGLYIYQEKRIAKYMKELDRIESEIDVKNSEINKVMDKLEGKQDELLVQFGDISVLLSNQMSSRKIGEDFFRFIEKPEARAAYREQQRLLIDEIYSDLYDELGLNEEEIDELGQLLVDKEMTNLEILISLIKGNMSADEIAENERKFSEMLERADRNIRDFFEIDEYDIYLDYTESIEYRNFVRDYKLYLAEADLELEVDQEERLFEEIRHETSNYNFTEDLSMVELRRQGNLNPENRSRLNRYLDEQAELDRIIFERARDFLSEIQNEKLREFQIKRRNMTEMGFEVTSEMDVDRAEN